MHVIIGTPPAFAASLYGQGIDMPGPSNDEPADFTLEPNVDRTKLGPMPRRPLPSDPSFIPYSVREARYERACALYLAPLHEAIA